PYFGIFAGKLRRYFSLQNFIDPIFVIIGFFQSLFLIIRFWPNVVFSKGGFVSLPVTIAAWVLRRPIILHESDGRMGLANRIASKFSNKICVAFPDLVKCKKCILTGNPIRKSILHGNQNTGYQITGFTPEKPVILVWGGSLGAQLINELIEKNFNRLKHHFQIIHITGKDKGINIQDPNYCTFEYIDEELKHIYAITDFVIGRAGANSIYELALVQKPNILIPLKNADQQNNATYFEKVGASIILSDEEKLYDTLVALSNNPQKQSDMKEALKNVSKPNATKDIANLILNPNG
ncbi:UDP-N-acetylglucosamine--N-acetylmuramyl-(pentapeptide) pyrophosphoryl-undecaprenol N-acetylglucosamine transferase, partial [Patescibacteria group bacterium]|nr:UDP-N-acetylglucosamine--N-acetylmuramyl-(pentapeptide) pyrophosphoryl-undecaprenol N-acetylglucosamine transferase [Patescibacteria group bacterium]